ncbi:hypothetical protein [Streptomyces sp. SLBN-118]|uniref:hypothetical protein n=1 Tax=Streptomyces sp. SLBN-118 TaxID=2768454 RepID=UPI0021B16491|nr:hypothetical protein [Streptomyces sp. SLBN-118]
MARRAEEAQVFQPVVETVAVDVVDLQDERLALPSGPGAALAACLAYPRLAERTAQQRGRRPWRSGFESTKDLRSGLARG